MKSKLWFVALAAFAACACSAAPPSSRPGEAFFLKNKDRVGFLGDSITRQDLYTRWIERFVTAWHPELQIEFFNGGENSGTAQQGLDRLKPDVLVHSPTVVSVCFGINDCALDVPLAEYLTSQRKLIAAIRAAGARPVLFTPTCLHESDAQGKRLTSYPPEKLSNQKLEKWVAALKQLARDENVPIIDLFHPLLHQDELYGRFNPGQRLIPDGVHPGETGHMVLMMEVLKAWGLIGCQ